VTTILGVFERHAVSIEAQEEIRAALSPNGAQRG
jgi:hypothetical protein